jgi:hypothetical protein
MPARVVRALVVALSAALLPVAGASAEVHEDGPSPVRGGRLDWGVKSSFQSYVTGPVAKGGFKLKNGAATAGRHPLPLPLRQRFLRPRYGCP